MRLLACLPLALILVACNNGSSPYADGGTAPDMGGSSGDGALPAPVDSPWSFEHPLPQGNALQAVAQIGGEVYAVGDEGTVVHLSPAQKSARLEARGLLVTPLRAVFGSGSTVWAVGDGGFVLRSDSGKWTLSRAGSQALYTGWQNGQQTYVAGLGSQIYASSGSGWSGQALPSQGPADTIRAALLLGKELYLAGSRGRILHQTGSSWFLEGDGVTTAELFVLVAAQDGSLYAGGAGGRLVRRDKKTGVWTSEHPLPDRMPLTGTDIRGLWTIKNADPTKDDIVYALSSDGALLHRGEMGWDKPMTVALKARLRGAAASDSGVYAVGDAGTLLYQDKVDMPFQAAPTAVQLTTAGFTGIAGMGTDAYAVTDEGRVLKRSVQGGNATWAVDYTPTAGTAQPLTGVAWVSQEAYAVGLNGLILHHTMQGWTSETYAFNGRLPDLRAVWIKPGEVYAVGVTNSMAAEEVSVILHKANGMWSQEQIIMPMSDPIQAELYGVAGDSSGQTNEVFAVGSVGTILRRQGTSWVAEAQGLFRDVQLLSIYQAGTIYYAVGSRGTVLRRDPGMGTPTWTRSAVPGVTGTLDVLLSTPGGLWAAGANGTVARQQGDAWTLEPTLYQGTLQSLFFDGQQLLLAVGTDGAVLRRSIINGK